MIIDEIVKMRINRLNSKHYKTLGYVFKDKEEIEVNVKDLTEGSCVKVNCECDICGKICNISYNMYLKILKNLDIILVIVNVQKINVK